MDEDQIESLFVSENGIYRRKVNPKISLIHPFKQWTSTHDGSKILSFQGQQSHLHDDTTMAVVLRQYQHLVHLLVLPVQAWLYVYLCIRSDSFGSDQIKSVN